MSFYLVRESLANGKVICAETFGYASTNQKDVEKKVY